MQMRLSLHLTMDTKAGGKHNVKRTCRALFKHIHPVGLTTKKLYAVEGLALLTSAAWLN
jgi:hypothetical protein